MAELSAASRRRMILPGERKNPVQGQGPQLGGQSRRGEEKLGIVTLTSICLAPRGRQRFQLSKAEFEVPRRPREVLNDDGWYSTDGTNNDTNKVSGDGPEYEDEYEDEDEARDDSAEDGDDDVDMEEEPSEQDGINLELFNYYGWAGHSHAVSKAQPQTYDASRAACGGENTWMVSVDEDVFDAFLARTSEAVVGISTSISELNSSSATLHGVQQLNMPDKSDRGPSDETVDRIS
ncbi:hypothetical protein V495_06944 [Pseudogymnoascus sp. VKM F-4514 (FW-929)]|nr:hypothetical protein V495_06944 [Pseudogymnoascus sp. VKM F-4514 (FW-929)]KFY56513.1 hypothetical protein V497_06206 [Pseudogymnoascus sp. VKM F-4516 (FW-969)]